MNFEIVAHKNTSQARIDLLKNAAKFYAKYLKLTDFKYKVLIWSAPHIRKRDNNNGFCCKTNDKEITIAIDSKLPMLRTLITLAHEMVHAKQYIRGQYRAELARNGKFKRIWCGKQYSVAYTKRPWEIEAFGREMELVHALLDSLVKKVSKNKKSIDNKS